MINLIFLGTGNAFGHGGRRRSCYLVEGSRNWLIDAGYDALSGLRSLDKIISDIDYIFISHLHPDHYMGIPQFCLEDNYAIKSEKNIPIYGPIGLKKAIIRATALFFDANVVRHLDELFTFNEVGPNETIEFDGNKLETFPAIHGGNARMQKFTFDEVTIGYTGDTAFDISLFSNLLNSDIIITEASSFSHRIPNHITCQELIDQNFALELKIYLSHVGQDVILNKEAILPPLYLSDDGMVVNLSK